MCFRRRRERSCVRCKCLDQTGRRRRCSGSGSSCNMSSRFATSSITWQARREPVMTDPEKTSDVVPRGATTSEYLKEAFFFRWNLLFFLGGTAAVALTPLAPVLLPLVGAGELAYLAGLISMPRFRAAIDAKPHAQRAG